LEIEGMNLTCHDYQGAEDAVALRQLLRENIRVNADLAVLDWCRFITQANAETLPQLRLWRDEAGSLAAFEWPDFGGSEIIPRHTRTDADAIFAHIVACEEAAAAGAPVRIILDEREGQRSAWLHQRGYQVAPGIAFYACRDLREAIPAPRLAAGYTLSEITHLPDLDGRVACERAAMPWSPTTVALYDAIQAMPDYRADLDLVVLAPNGEVAAFCGLWAEPDTGIGVVEPIGCHPAHQRCGLGTALLNEGMQRLRASSVRAVYVGNGPVPETLDTPGPPRRLTASVGFRHVAQKCTWVKPTK
jgi:ribosomal protein S18 acetylase RimI-like enzyme